MMKCRLLWVLGIHVLASADGFAVYSRTRGSAAGPPFLRMGILDSLSNFLSSRDGDFIKLEETETFGPGPLLILYKIPPGIEDDEIKDMLSDGAPNASQKGVKLARIASDKNEILKCTLEEALTSFVEKDPNKDDKETLSRSGCPVLFFSGFDNKEMMATYDILGSEIYAESGEASACAKAVPNAMMKSFGQVLEEISGDHKDAMMGEEQ